MSTFRDNDFAERRNAALEARKAMLAKFQAASGPDEPAVQARKAERRAKAEARAAREAEQARVRREEREGEARAKAEADAARIAAEAERQAAIDAKKSAKSKSELGLATRVIADEAARKAKRGARKSA